MAFIRFLTAIAVRVIMGLAGLALAAFGIFEFVGAIAVLVAMRSFAASTQIEGMPEANFEVPEPPLGFLVQLLGIKAGIALIGIVLLVLAIRGLIARIRAGLPSDDEAVGKSFFTRIVNALIYGAGFAFGAFSLAVSIGPGLEMASAVATGTTIEATVTGFTPGDGPRAYTASFEFTAEGQHFTGTYPVTSTDPPTISRLPDIKVTYPPGHPDQFRVTEEYSHNSFLFFLAFRIFLVVGGLWGLSKNLSPPPPAETIPSPRNLGPTRRDPAPSPRFDPQPTRVAPASTRSVVSARRQSFGRRGA